MPISLLYQEQPIEGGYIVSIDIQNFVSKIMEAVFINELKRYFFAINGEKRGYCVFFYGVECSEIALGISFPKDDIPIGLEECIVSLLVSHL